MRMRGAELEPEEENELYTLHRKGNKGIGSTTPTQLQLLNQLKEAEDAGKPISSNMERQLEFLTGLQ